MTHRPPPAWRVHRLDEVTAIAFSSVDKKSAAGEAPVRLCNYMHVWKNPYIRAGMDFMPATASSAEIRDFHLRQHDVLLTKDSETREEIAEPSVVVDAPPDLVLGYHLALLRPRPEVVFGPFLAAQLRLPQFRQQFVRAASGATRYGLTLDAVSSATVWLPPLSEQRRIAEILNAVDDAIEGARAVIEQTRRLKSALLQDLLTHGLPGRHTKFQDTYRLGRIPADWQVQPLRRLADIQQGIALGPQRQPDKYPTPYLRVANVQMGDLDLSEVKEIEVTPAERDRYALAADDVLMVEGHANVADLGRAALVTPAAVGMVCQNHLFRVRTDRAKLDPRYLVFWVNSLPGRRYFRIFGGTTSGLNTVGSGDIGRLQLPIAPPDEQRVICDAVEQVEARLRRASVALGQATSAKAALSQALLTGQVPVNV